MSEQRASERSIEAAADRLEKLLAWVDAMAEGQDPLEALEGTEGPAVEAEVRAR